jgi:hypothetical protein
MSLGRLAERSGWCGGMISEMRCLTAVCCVLALGCASFRDAVNEDVLYLKMCGEAERMWRDCRHVYPEDQPYHKDFEKGFMDGYVAVGFGANGCPPTLPSKEYWKPRFKNPEGKARTATWYNGYAAGAYAALSSGVQDRNRLPTAGELYGRNRPQAPSISAPLIEPEPMLDAMPPEPEAIPPAVEPAPPPLLESAWRSTPPAPMTMRAETSAPLKPAPVVEASSESEREPGAVEPPALTGSFGLSRPE